MTDSHEPQEDCGSYKSSSGSGGKGTSDGRSTSSSYNHTTFRDLDDPTVLDESLEAIKTSTTSNFVVDFREDAAYVQFDLTSPAWHALLQSDISDEQSQHHPHSHFHETHQPQPQHGTTRWINLWYPFQQRNVLGLLAKRYDFSPRLLALMYSDPTQSRRGGTSSVRVDSQRDSQTFNGNNPRRVWQRRAAARRAIMEEQQQAMELGDGGDELSEYSSLSASTDSLGRSNIYWILEDIWHYTSLDLGRTYVCVGFNTLYGTKDESSNSDGQAKAAQNDRTPLPQCMRIWTWLIITDDNTVISIHEDPFPHVSPRRLSASQRRLLTESRRNLLTIFRSLSTVHELPLMVRNPMTVLPFRTRLGDTAEETAHRAADAPGLLFYYLFENWQNSYTLVTRKESRYGVELQRLRSEMFQRPQLGQIDRLDGIGRELGVLRRHYESYNRIIGRLLEPVARSSTSMANSRLLATRGSQSSLETVRPTNAAAVATAAAMAAVTGANESSLGVSFSAAARVRFKRLKDMIDLYALCEVEEYIKQKDSLVKMNFSLIAIKQSSDVERLTRVTLLLTKATMLFLPVSLMTSYFDVSLSDVEFTLKQYWVSFAVIFALSWVCIFVFGIMSGSMQAPEVWSSIKKGVERLRQGGGRTRDEAATRTIG